ncbi:zinc finger BED domain-containing protein RICESLEEPER 1-like [Camellia sinensis]|uniref:zinc finger BED domain-containing protein RICESLEEPER 1-like n=1 Tax=Camellia sinensis TaxID=4442 RepID=UPI00103565CF|nr:zinc finger BED domain-containing protein RICESLEEPER 1-like [Camellia sinensis]
MVWNLDATSVSITLFDGSGGYERDYGGEFSIGGNDLDYEFSGSNTISGLRETEMSRFNDKNAFKEQEAHNAIAKLFCCAALPPQTVEEFYYVKKIYNYLNPKVCLSVDDVGHYCLETYEEVKAKVKQVLRNLDRHISFSVDILRYEKRYEYPQDYLCLIAYFIDDNWKLKKWILGFSQIWDGFSELPHKIILKSLKDWEIEKKISTITMLNDNLYRETCEIVKDHIQGKTELQLNGCLFKVHCYGDIVSRMVQVAYKAINNIIDNVCELCSFGKSLPLWYLTSAQHKDALELGSGGEFSSQDVRDNYEVPSAEECEKVRSICEPMDNIYEVTVALFESKYPTANAYLYHLRELQAILIQKSTSTDRFIQRVTRKMLKKFDKYWKDRYLVLLITMVMDPRFKMKYLEFSSSKFDDSDGIPGVTTVLEAICSLFNNYVIKFPERDNISSDSTSSSEFEEEEDIEEDSYKNIEEEHHSLDDRYKLLPDYIQFIQSTQGLQPQLELDWYLEEPVMSWTHEFNALSWWRNASSKKRRKVSNSRFGFVRYDYEVAARVAIQKEDGLWCGNKALRVKCAEYQKPQSAGLEKPRGLSRGDEGREEN